MSSLQLGILCAVLSVVTAYIGYLIGREVERSYQADRRRGWK